jgi:hypothetical protein
MDAVTKEILDGYNSLDEKSQKECYDLILCFAESNKRETQAADEIKRLTQENNRLSKENNRLSNELEKMMMQMQKMQVA